MREFQPSRRAFLTQSTGAALAAAAAPSLMTTAHAAGSDVLRVGLIGCGGRGTGAAINATNAGKDVKIVALADIFDVRLQESRATLQKNRPEQVDLPDDRCFVGFDAYQKLIDCGVDVVLIAPASHFIPEMLKAAIAADKHVFCEKPHGIDIPGVKSVAATCEEAARKGLSVVSGLCWRFDPGVRETMKRVHDGAIGEIVAIQETYLSQPYVMRERLEGQSEIEYQFWNWYHFNWLSGDQAAQQLIHSLDKSSWALGDKPPLRAWGLGGRQTCLDPKFGDQFDHKAAVFEYDNGVRVFSFTRDQEDCYRDTSDIILGTRGRCDLLKHTIEGENPWKYEGPKASMYDVEHAELFESIRTGNPINNGPRMCLSTAVSIMSQMAAYSGQLVTWDDVMNSTRTYAQSVYSWDMEPPVTPGPDGRYPTAMQGKDEWAKWVS